MRSQPARSGGGAALPSCANAFEAVRAVTMAAATSSVVALLLMMGAESGGTGEPSVRLRLAAMRHAPEQYLASLRLAWNGMAHSAQMLVLVVMRKMRVQVSRIATRPPRELQFRR